MSFFVNKLRDIEAEKLKNLSCRVVEKHVEVCTKSGTWRIRSLHSAVKEERECILFLHGTNSSAFMYLDVFERLSDEFYVVSVDIPGFGVSRTPDNFLSLDVLESLDEYANALAQFCDKHEIPTIICVGHSFGAFLSVIFSERYPRLVQQVILVNMPGILPTLTQYGFYWSMLFKFRFPQQLIRFFFQRAGFRFLSCLCKKNSDLLHYYCFTSLEGGEGDLVLSRCISWSLFRAYWRYPVIHKLVELKVPYSFVWGEDDTILPKEDAQLLSHGTVECHLIKKAGHNPITSSAEDFCNILKKIIQNPSRFESSVPDLGKKLSILLQNPELFSSSPLPFRTLKTVQKLRNSVLAYLE